MASTAAYYATKGILPSTFLSLPPLDQLFMMAAKVHEEKRQREILDIILRALGVRFR